MAGHWLVLEEEDGRPRDFGAISLFCMAVSTTDLVNIFSGQNDFMEAL